jgi:hypothetical protein
MKDEDWSSPEIRAVGRKYAAKAYNLADELHARGADASQLLLSYKEIDMTRPRTITLPTMMVDALMALCLALPRQKSDPDRPLAENVTPLRLRPALNWKGEAKCS